MYYNKEHQMANNENIFYDNSIPDLSQILKNIEPYVLYDIPKREKTKLNDNIVENEMIENYEMIYPKHQDSFFWSIYIAEFGYSDYLQVSRNYGVRQSDVNCNAMTYLQKHQGIFKEINPKITKVKIQEILSDLSTINKTTSMDAVFGLCVYFKINLYIVDKDTNGLLKIITNNENTYLVNRERKIKYSVCANELSDKKIKELEQTYFILDSHIRPLKSISNYKVDELIDIAVRLELYDYNCKYKKNEIYNMITIKMRW